MKILVLEDNERLLKTISMALGKEGYQVDTFTDGEDALEATMNGYSCFVLDINVPSLDGISILESLRMVHKEVPVIIISSNTDFEKIKISYEFGCNDYLKKPFFMYELVHKIKSLCKNEKDILNLNENFIFNFKKHILLKDNEEIKLAKKEILFLELLGKNPNKVCTFEEIEEYVWEGEATTLVNIRALVKRIRKKIPEESIKIVKGLGYSINLV